MKTFALLCLTLLAAVIGGGVTWAACTRGEPCDNGLGRYTGMMCR